jgi:DNA polymerase type B, organellar and viral
VILNNVHVPYAAGLLVVHPGNDVAAKDGHIYNYFSEDYSMIIPSFEERSTKMLVDFLERIAFLGSTLQGVTNVYFHNFSRFDGILLMKFLATNMVKYSFRPLMRNNKLYQLSVYSQDKQGQNKMVFRLRDSYTLLSNSLEKLANTLCPHLGSKGSIVHDEVKVSELQENRAKLLDYMTQDIRLLGGVMLRAQEIYWRTYNVDISECLTLSSLAMNIYRTRYYDQEGWPIYIPSSNQDAFIRRGYYGGHADTYKPYGENLYYYDVNSLYPFVMKTFAMPGGKPVWHGNLEDLELDEIFGFIEAYVVCPSTITRPFIPYKNKDNTLLFQTGQFVGVYYSEELKYARNLGYQIIPLRGYLFEKMSSPFESFVSDLFACRQDAKIRGDEAITYVYKILMNTLYDRFGINPESTITEVCKKERYDYLIQKANIISGNKVSDHYYLVSYHSKTGHADNSSD